MGKNEYEDSFRRSPSFAAVEIVDVVTKLAQYFRNMVRVVTIFVIFSFSKLFT
jgi:hypothetical protein